MFSKVIPLASEEQLLLVELVRSISVMRTETVIQTVKEVLKQPPAIAKDKVCLSGVTVHVLSIVQLDLLTMHAIDLSCELYVHKVYMLQRNYGRGILYCNIN